MALRKILASIIASVWLPLDGSGTLYGQPVEGGKIYWTEARDLGWIQRSSLGGFNLESLLTTDIVAELKINPRRIALDRFGKMYWTDWHEDADEVTVRRANVDGSDVETLLTGVHAQDFALDVYEDKIYWTDPRAGTIHRADLDGANVETLLTGLEDPGYIALDVVWYYLYDPCPVCITGTPPDSSPDPDRRTAAKTAVSVGAPTKMYWTERNGKSHPIRRSNLDGSNVETLVTLSSRLSGIAIAAYDEMIYWTEWDTGTIRAAFLDGSNVETLVTGLGSPSSLVVDAYSGKIAWTEWDTDTIRMAYARRYRFTYYGALVSDVEDPLSLAVDHFGGALDAGVGIYWTERESNKIHRRDGQGRSVVPLGIDGPEGIAIDVAGEKMYWADQWTDAIRRSDLDGENIEDLVTGVEDPRDIALDLVAGRMYWTEQGTGTIRRADLDGTNGETLIEAEGPKGIALDVIERKMYWTAKEVGRFSDVGVVQRSNLNGANVETLVAGLGDPEDIALDLVAGKIYYSVGHTADRSACHDRFRPLTGCLSRIRRSNLDGSNSEPLVSRVGGPVEIALDVVEGKMYWADKRHGKIHRSDLDGGNVEEIVTGLVRPVGIALDVPPPVAPLDRVPPFSTEIEATVLGGQVEGLTVEFARVAAYPLHFAWSANTNTAGRLSLTITNQEEAEVSGLYEARARNEEGEVVGRWHSIPLNQGRLQILELTLGGDARVVAVERLGPNPDPCSNGIAVPDPRVNRGLVKDCRALLAFRDALGSVDWSAATPITRWEGVYLSWEGVPLSPARVTWIAFGGPEARHFGGGRFRRSWAT